MIRGETVCLRPPCDGDLDRLLEMRSDRQLQHLLMADAQDNGPDDVRNWLRRRNSETHSLFFIIGDAETDACAGFIQLIGIRPRHCDGALGIAVHSEFSGRGFASEAIALLENHAAVTRGLRKITLQVMQQNERAVQLYERLGFRRVGVLVQHYEYDGSYLDVLVMERMVPAATLQQKELRTGS